MKLKNCGETLTDRGRAHIVGLGLIGSSIALALSKGGWRVTGWDSDARVNAEAEALGIQIEGVNTDAELTFVCVPAGAVANTVREVSTHLSSQDAIITDVAGVKAAIVRSISDPRFIGGHPMAGSELRGPRSADSEMFRGANWILTPSEGTTPTHYSRLHTILRELGATVVAVDPDQHDRLMAIASHVPHLVAGALMNEATDSSQYDAVLLQLAAGGFRDMTRIAAGDPAIWPDVLFENRDAVKDTLNSLISRMQTLLGAIETSDRSELERLLQKAAEARRALPGRAVESESLAYLRIELSDEPGQLARVAVTASDMLVNIFDIEISHSASEAFGTLLLAVDSRDVQRFIESLVSDGFMVGQT